MGLVAYLVFGALAGLTIFRAVRSHTKGELIFWVASGVAFLVVAVIAAYRGIGEFADIIFYFLALVCVISAIRVVSQTNPVYSAVWLITVFLCLAVLFILKRAEFLAAIQVLIYAGAIMVLYVFIFIFVDIDVAMEETASTWMIAGALGVAAALLIVLTPVALSLRGHIPDSLIRTDYHATRTIGEAIYFGATLPFEATSLILLVALVGAVLIGKVERE
jgi:NADH-quinone oxidoreductase subunit J